MCLADLKCSANDLWKQFKDSLIEGMNQYIPQKPISSKHRLPWVDKAIKTLIQARNTVYVKWQRSKSPRLPEKLRTIRHRLQKQMRQAYWAHMETIIDFFFSPIQCPYDRAPKQKKICFFIRSLRKDSSGVSPLLSEGEIAPILELIYCRSIQSVIVPSDWKTANIDSIFKKGDKHKASNYRPVSYSTT